MSMVDDLQKTIAAQKAEIQKAEESIKSSPEDVRIRQEKILQLVAEEMESLEAELSKYLNYTKL